GEIEALKELPTDRRIRVGLLNPKTEIVDSSEEIVAKAKRAADLSGAHRISLNPDCGLATLENNPVRISRLAEAKLSALAHAAELPIGGDEALLHFQGMVAVVRLQQHQYGRQIDLLVSLDDRLRAAFGHRFFCPPVLQMRLNEFFAVGLFGVAEAIQRVYHRPASDHIRETSIDLSMVWQRQRRITSVSRSKRTQHDLMAAAGIPERSYSGRSVELGRVRLEPA